MRRKERGRQLLRILKLIKLFEHSRYGLTISIVPGLPPNMRLKLTGARK